MKFFSDNIINTTSMISGDGVSSTYAYLFDGDETTKFIFPRSSSTSFYFTITFPTLTAINGIYLKNHNLSEWAYRYKDSAGSLDLIIQNTASSTVTLNSFTSTFFAFDTITAYSISINPNDGLGLLTTTANFEIGELGVIRDIINFERNPSHAKYMPTIYKKQIRHEMPDGGVIAYNIDTKFRARIGFEFISESFKDSLYQIWNTNASYNFIDYDSTPPWDGVIRIVSFVGNLDFKPSHNQLEAGWSGTINIEETP